MKIVIDSNRYSDLRRGNQEVADFLGQVDEIHIPLIVLAEQRAGFAAGTRRAENERLLNKFLNQPGVFVLKPQVT